MPTSTQNRAVQCVDIWLILAILHELFQRSVAMKVNVTGPKGGEVNAKLKATITRTLRLYAKELGISKIRNTIWVRVHHRTLIDGDAEGMCTALTKRKFVIDLCMYTDWLAILAHEMVHVKQFSTEELALDMNRWKSRKNVSALDYWDQPWEREAFRLQSKLKALLG